MSRRLIVNADDFGFTSSVNRGIVEAHDHGVVTSTTLMVRAAAAAEAAELAAEHPALAVGLHVDLGEWAFRDGQWEAVYQVVDTDDADAVEHEIESQLAAFDALLRRPPTHLDSHQHVHRSGPAAEIVAAAGRRLGVPVRHVDQRVAYVGSFYGQLTDGSPYHEALEVEALIALLSALPEGTAELGCHPGYVDGLQATGTMYVEEREAELRALCDSRVRKALTDMDIELVSFAQLA